MHKSCSKVIVIRKNNSRNENTLEKGKDTRMLSGKDLCYSYTKIITLCVGVVFGLTFYIFADNHGLYIL